MVKHNLVFAMKGNYIVFFINDVMVIASVCINVAKKTKKSKMM